MERGDSLYGFVMPKEERANIKRSDTCDPLVQFRGNGGDGLANGALCNAGVGACFKFGC